jgi:hypothetical protein
MWPFGSKKPAESRFWEWFLKNEDRLFTSEPPAAIWMEELPRELRRVHKCLVWQLSPARGGKREFVISADGIREAFSAVESLADAAPKLPRWTIVRFRPREPGYHEQSLIIQSPKGTAEVKAEEMECAIVAMRHKDGTVKIAIELFIPGCPEGDPGPFQTAAFLMLDAALGEYDMECKVGFVGIYPLETEAEAGEKIPFARLREEFDELVERTLGNP